MTLALDNVTVRYGEMTAVRAVSLEIRAGEVVALLGASGSGKSTLALAAMGLLPLEATVEGAILCDNRPLAPTDRGSRVAMVFQDPATALNPALTIGRQIGEAEGLTRAEVASAMAGVGLIVPPSRYPHQLSGGQRQRVAIAAALAGQPAYLIADEPTASLDPASRAEIAALLERLVRERGLGLLLVTHDLALAERLADRVVVLDRGAVSAAMPVPIAPRPAPPAPRDPVPLLEVAHVSRRYGSVTALEDASLAVRQGETVAITGPSGAGKSTLARIALGLERADSGSVRLAGLDPFAGGRTVRRLAQAVFQDPATSFDPRHAVGRIVADPLRLAAGAVDREALVAGALADVGLDPAFAARMPATLSGGQRQRVALARALVLGPKLVVLDEPLSALDPATRGAMIDLLLRLQATHGLAYLLIAHDVEVVEALAHRVVEMRAGRIAT